METYGCIDNCLDDFLYEDLIQISNLIPYLSGFREKKPKMLDIIRWIYGTDTDNEAPGVYPNSSSRNNPQLVNEIYYISTLLNIIYSGVLIMLFLVSSSDDYILRIKRVYDPYPKSKPLAKVYKMYTKCMQKLGIPFDTFAKVCYISKALPNFAFEAKVCQILW